jgi:tRNA A37 threonylcarbamoyladenosine modification protein TsaB
MSAIIPLSNSKYLLFLPYEFEFKNMLMNKYTKMNFLVIDGAKDKICFFSHYNNYSYNKSFESSKNNYEKFSILLFDFLNQNNINLSKISHLFVNQGPGSFSGIRTSISVAKGLTITNKINLYGFNSCDLKDMNYMNIVFLYEKKRLTKNLIKPLYIS